MMTFYEINVFLQKRPRFDETAKRAEMALRHLSHAMSVAGDSVKQLTVDLRKLDKNLPKRRNDSESADHRHSKTLTASSRPFTASRFARSTDHR
jgi:hypothetical protein